MRTQNSMKDPYIREANELAEEIEDLLVIKSLTTGLDITVRVLDYSWLGSTRIVVNIGSAEESFSVGVDSNGYKFRAETGDVAVKLENFTNGKSTIQLKNKESVLQVVRRFVL